ncbi:quinon protein alcohol dehydrogenase-like superfamily, partial [Dichomitus squalens]
HDGAVQALVASSDSKWIASAAHDGKIILWDVRQQIPTREWTASGKGQEFFSLAFSHDSRRLAAAGGGELAVWRIDDQGAVSRSNSLGVEGTTIRGCAWSHDDAHLAIDCADATIRILYGSTLQESRVLRLQVRRSPSPSAVVDGGPGGKHLLFFHGRWLLSARPGFPRHCCLWDLASGRLRKVLQGHTAPVTTAALDPTGTRLATASMDHTVRIWDTEGGALITVLRGHSGPILDVAFSPDGKFVLSASEDKKAKIWPVSGGECTLSFKHFNSVYAAGFSPDGRYVATTSWDHTVRLFKVEDGSLVRRLWEHEGAPVRHVVFSPDGETLWSGADDGSVSGRRLSNVLRA